MHQRFRVFGLVLGLALLAGSVFALGGDQKAEFDAFVKAIREDRRVDRVGYLIEVQLPPNKTNDTKIFSLAGKYCYAWNDGYLTHVNYVRLQRMQGLKVPVRIIDKKRLDDESEAWYLVWCANAADDRALRDRFEPLFSHEHTRLIRIRPSDEDELQKLGLRYAVVEEALLPLRRLPPSIPAFPKFNEPDPQIAALVATINAASLTADVQSLEDFVTRAVKQPGNVKAHQWIADQFRAIGGLEVSTHTFNYSPGTLDNVVAIKRGRRPTDVVIVGAHSDSTAGYSNSAKAPGADDNGSGVAGVLAIARAVAPLDLRDTVIFCAFNAEEVGLVGSKALARKFANDGDLKIKAMLNLDMIADCRDDNNVALIGNTASNWLIDLMKSVALTYVKLESTCLYNSKIWYSDHSSFWNIGVPALLSIEGYPEMTPHYHKVTDTVSNLSSSFMEKVARANLAALLTLNPIQTGGEAPRR